MGYPLLCTIKCACISSLSHLQLKNVLFFFQTTKTVASFGERGTEITLAITNTHSNIIIYSSRVSVKTFVNISCNKHVSKTRAMENSNRKQK